MIAAISFLRPRARLPLGARTSSSALRVDATGDGRAPRGKLLRFLVLFGLTVVSAFAADLRPPKLFLIGGSTLATFPETRPVVGWGQMLPPFFKDPTQVDNRGRSGRSTKSFIEQGLWTKVHAELAPGDFVVIAFGGGNESKDDPQRRTEPRGSYRANLERSKVEIVATRR